MAFDWFIGFLGTFTISMVLMIVLALFMLKTPAMTFLAASLGGKSIIGIIRKDKVAQFVTTRYESGTLETKRLGTYAVTPASVYREKKSGVGFMITNANVGITMPTQMYQFTQKLKQAGLRNLDEAKEENEKLKVGKLKEMGVRFYRDASGNPTHNASEDQIKEANEHGLKASIEDGHTISFDDFEQYMEINAHPSSMMSAIENKVAIERMEERKPSYKWVPLVAVLLVSAAIAFFIIWQATQSGSVPVTVTVDSQAVADALRSGVTAPPSGEPALVG